MKTLKEKVNIAPSSNSGHYVKGAKQVINLNEVNETFAVTGASVLETENHQTLVMEEDCLITCQNVLNPFTNLYEKSRD